MNINIQRSKVILSCTFVLTLFFLLIKINFFIDFFPRFDSAFYIKWIIDLNNSIRILPSGDSNIYENLISDYNSLIHNYFKRIYNNVALLYHFIPVVINYFIGEIFNFYYKTFNLLSIIANSILAFIFTFSILKRSNLEKYDIIIVLFLTYLFFTSFTSLFFLSPLGIHNYSLISLLVSFLVLENNYKKKKIVNIETLILGLLLPIFTHHFNLVIIFLLFFLILILRFYNNQKILKDSLIILTIFVILTLPILILSEHHHNKKLLNIFFSTGITQENIYFLNKILLYLFYNTKTFIINFSGHLGFFGSILFFIAFYKSELNLLKKFLILIVIIFILLPLSPYFDRLYNYFLLFAIFLICREFTNLYKKQVYKFIFLVLFVLTIVDNFLQISFVNYRSDFNNKLITRFPNNEIWKKRFIEVVDYVGNNKIIFFDYQASDSFYSVFNKVDKEKIINNNPPVTNLFERYFNNDNNYLRLKKIDKNYYKDTYIIFFSLKKNKEDFLNNVCYLQKKFFNKCYNLMVIDKYNFIDPLEYQDGQNVIHNFQLILFKSE